MGTVLPNIELNVSIGDPSVYLTSLVIGSVFFEGLKMTR